MKSLGTLLAILTALLFLAILPAAAWIYTGTQRLLDANTYKEALARPGVYTDLIPALLPALAEEAERQQPPDPAAMTFLNLVGNLDSRAWATIAKELIPAEWLQQQVESNLDGFFAWLHGRTPVPDIRFDTGSLRERLSGLPGQRAVNLILQSWPPCTPEQLDVLLNYQAGSGDAFPFCQPPGEYLAVTSDALSRVLRAQASQLPDGLPPPDWLDDAQTRAELARLQQGVRFVQALTLEMILVPAALLALIVFFTVRSLKSFGRWSGWLLVIGGIFIALPIPLLLSSLLTPDLLTATGTKPNPAGLAAASGPALGYVGEILDRVFRSLVGELTLPVLILAAITIGLGFLALVVSALVRSPEEHLQDDLPPDAADQS